MILTLSKLNAIAFLTNLALEGFKGNITVNTCDYSDGHQNIRQNWTLSVVLAEEKG